MAENETNVIDNKRFFLGPDNDTRYFIDAPTAEDIRGADWQYSKAYTRCLMEDIPTSAEMLDILTRRGIIGSEFEQRANELSLNLANVISALETVEADDLDTKRKMSVDVAQAREELFQWNQRLNGPMNNSAEQISDDARLEYLTSAMVKTEDEVRIWEDYADYLKEKNQAMALRARFEVMLFLQGLESDFLDQTPEAQAMKEVEEDIISKAQEALKTAEAISKEEEADAKKETAKIAKLAKVPIASKAKQPAKKPAKKPAKAKKKTDK